MDMRHQNAKIKDHYLDYLKQKNRDLEFQVRLYEDALKHVYHNTNCEWSRNRVMLALKDKRLGGKQ